MPNVSDRATAVIMLIFVFVCLATAVLPVLLQAAGLVAIIRHLLGS